MTLLWAEFPGNKALREQMSKAAVRRIDADGSLEIAVTDGPRAEVVRRIPVEAEAADRDGEDTQPVGRLPAPEDLRILVL